MTNPFEYYDLSTSYKLDGAPTNAITTMSLEGFAAMSVMEPARTHLEEEEEDEEGHEGLTGMSSTLSPDDVKKIDTSSEVNNPYGYGYVAPLSERRNQDAQDILSQENMLFSVGAVTGISLIVLGILITSANN